MGAADAGRVVTGQAVRSCRTSFMGVTGGCVRIMGIRLLPRSFALSLTADDVPDPGAGIAVARGHGLLVGAL